MQAKKILLTGAAGKIGTVLRPVLAERTDALISADLVPLEPSAANERS